MKKLILIFAATAILFSSCLSTSELRLIDKITGFSEKNNTPEAKEKREEAFKASVESIQKATEEITPEQEYYIGRTVASTILNKYRLSNDDKELTVYLNQICNAITLNSEKPYLYKGYFVAVLDSDEINAMATPGGHILITRGLIECTNSEDALAAVIAHEIGHIQLKHSISSIKSSRTTDAIMTTVSAAVTNYTAGMNDKIQELTDGLSDAANDIAKNLVETGFSKAQEFAADKKALYLMADAGYDPGCMIDMLTLLQMNSEGQKSGMKKTHPSPESRIENVTKELELLDVRVSSSDKKLRT